MQKKFAAAGAFLASLLFSFSLMSCDDGSGIVVTHPQDDVLNCQDECVPNAMKCTDNKSYVCGFFDADRCSEWSAPLNCPNGCDENECHPPLCDDQCKVDERRCDGVDGFEYCTLSNDACLVWSDRVACLDGGRCSEGRCLSGVACDDACPLGTRECVSLTSARSCIVDSDGCAIWGTAEVCQTGHQCADGLCVKDAPSCTNECFEGELGCASSTATRNCVVGKDGCTVWSASQACQTAYQCEDGKCVKAPPTCTNACVKGARQCANATQYQLCDFYGGSSCTTWGTAQGCGSNKVCKNGACVDACTNACTNGTKVCEGAGFKTCGDLNKDGCTEWSSITACPYGCDKGVCKPDPNAWVPKCTTNPCPKVISSFPYRLSSTTKGGVNNIGAYTSCSNLSQAGPEEYFVFRVTTPGFIVAGLTETRPVDVDIHLLSGLSASQCIARSDKNIVEHITAGVYYLSVDTFTSADNAGAYTLNVTFLPDSGNCGIKSGIMKRINTPSQINMPATGPVVKEAHLVTTVDQAGNTSWWPSTKTDSLDKHKSRTASNTGIVFNRTENWAPAGEGGSKYGQGSTGRAIPEDAEAWYVCMYWAKETRPAAGTRYLVINPANGKAVVAAAGYETGPGEGTMIGGAVEEVHHHCSTGHKSILTFAELRNQLLPYGPITCK